MPETHKTAPRYKAWCSYPVLGGGSDEALGRVLVLDTRYVPSQDAVDVTELHQ